MAESKQKNISLRLWLSCWLVYFIFRALTISCRYRIVGQQHRDQAERMHPSRSFAFAMWHNNTLAAVAAHAKQNISPMISPSGDGELVAFVAQKLGLSPVRGSSSRDGEKARLELQSLVRRGMHAAYTVDGPRGPRYRVKPGIIDISRKEQVPILPMAAVADRYWTLRKTWDQFRIPKPFSVITVIYGQPYIMPADTQGQAFADAKLVLQEKLLQLEGDLVSSQTMHAK